MPAKIRKSPQTIALILALQGNLNQWRYGYDLSRETGLKSGTLYPLLMRLRDAGWLQTRWAAPEVSGRPPRHMYRLTSQGKAWSRDLLNENPAGRLRKPVLAES